MRTNVALAVSAVIVGIVVSWYQRHSKMKSPIQFRGGAKMPKTPVATSVISPSELQDYRRDGFILKKGVVPKESLSELVQAAEDVYRKQNPKDWAGGASLYQKLTFDLWRWKSEFAQLAFEDLPSVAAEFLEPKEEDATIRILKDGFFGFQLKNNSGCGFHVDDKAFWPASYETTGVNFWIALSPMKVSEGGGIRVVNQSLVEPIFEECRTAITTPGPTGYPRTCQMEEVSPECHEKMLDASVAFDMEPGDALIWDRWTFHRSEPFRPASKDDSDTDEYRLRYTIRYVPGTAKAWGFHHPSQPTGEVYDSPYYPRVWPTAAESEIEAIQKGLEG